MNAPMQHVTDFVLDCAHAQELSPVALRELEAHLAQCGACRAREAAQTEQRAAFLSLAPSWQSYRARRARRPRRTVHCWRGGGLAVALAASVWLGLFRPMAQPTETSASTGTRSKGGPQLGFYVKRGEQVWRAHDGQTLRAGDVLRFTYSTPRPAYLALFVRDGQTVTTFFAAQVNQGADVPLDFGLTLDVEESEPEVHALFCREPFEVEPIRSRLTQVSGPPKAAEGCSWRTHRLPREP